METIKNNLANLLKVKTIVTILLTIVFCVLALSGVITSADFLTVFTVVIAFYFGTQAKKAAVITAAAGSIEGVTIPAVEQKENATETVNSAVHNEVRPPDSVSE